MHIVFSFVVLQALTLLISINSLDSTCKNKNGHGDASSLIASAIRKKNFLVFDVDVYQVDLYMSQKKLDAVKAARQYNPDLVTIVAENNVEDPGTHVALQLTFLRAVETNKIVDAIVEALMSPTDNEDYSKTLASFRAILINNIGSTGVRKDDEIVFIFGDNASIDIEILGSVAGTVKSGGLQHSLLNVYLGEKTIVPSLRTDILEKLKG